MANRPSYAQLEGLAEFLEQNPGIAKGLLRNSQGKMQTKRKWANLAITLNSVGGARKNGDGWAKYWAEKKCALKKQCAQLAASMRRTGGGVADNLPVLSAIEQRLVAVMGGHEFATGDSRFTVDPFPQMTIPTELPIVIEIADDHATSTPMTSPIPSTSQNDQAHSQASSTIPAHPTPLQRNLPPRQRRRRSSVPRPLDENVMEQLANLEARRVEGEMITAQAFAQLSEHMGNIASALTSIATAISDVARRFPNP